MTYEAIANLCDALGFDVNEVTALSIEATSKGMLAEVDLKVRRPFSIEVEKRPASTGKVETR